MIIMPNVFHPCYYIMALVVMCRNTLGTRGVFSRVETGCGGDASGSVAGRHVQEKSLTPRVPLQHTQETISKSK